MTDGRISFRRILFQLNILEFDHILYVHLFGQDSDTIHFSLICNRVMAPDKCQILVSSQYLENKLVGFYQIMYIQHKLIWSRFGLLHNIFRTFITELWPLDDVWILFPLNILRINW